MPFLRRNDRAPIPASNSLTAINQIPNEILSEVLSHLDLPTLFRCFNVSRLWRKTSEPFLVSLLDDTIIRLWFYQDGQRCRFLELSFKGYNPVAEKLIFACEKSAYCRFQSSKLVQSPQLQAITFSQRDLPLDLNAKNHLDRRVPLRVAASGQQQITSAKYNFTSNYPWTFNYKVEMAQPPAATADATAVAKSHELKTRRLVRPVTFECSPNFLDQNRLGRNLVCRWYQSKFGESGSIREWMRIKKWHGERKKFALAGGGSAFSVGTVVSV